ncbi:MAG TPA: acyl CoA:acetate/3-ketoacid CoA transferase [Clostridia bacterium]|nr:acyl CoA:acetate/3-ketoacid CoA transferase [Clostridia bacterium]
MSRPKFITAAEAAQLVKDGDTLGTVGFVMSGHPDELSYELEKRFKETGHPRDLTLTWLASNSNNRDRIGTARFAMEGFVKRVIGGHWGLTPEFGTMAIENKIEAYNIPQGVLCHVWRAKGGNKPGIITHVGLGTFADPREDGCKLNELTKEKGEDLVELITIDGKEYLLYKTYPINVAFIRGTTADENGNITMEKEGIFLEANILAYATKASGGIVIAQVENIAKAGTLNPQLVKVPGVVVDYVVQCSDPQKFHIQSTVSYYDPSLSGEIKVPLNAVKPIPLDERKVICRRAAMELIPNANVNLGIGMPEGVGAVAAEEGISDQMIMTVEPGPIGGVPCSGQQFGMAVNAEAIMDHPYQFDFYDGGGLDLAVLGLAEVDQYGNINVSKFGPRIAGAGGFINITQNAKSVIFAGTLTASGLKVEVKDGKLNIVQEGKVKKFIPEVGHKTFSGEYARKKGQKVLYITERAVFEMRPEGLTLTEIAPGIDLETQVLPYIDFEVKVAPDLKLMDERIFKDEPMGIKDEILAKAR